MKCIILAAGLGLRFNGSTNGQFKTAQSKTTRSKTTLPIGEGVPLLRHTVNTLRRLGLDEIVVVVGFDRESVTESLAGTNVTIIENCRYRTSNSITSAYQCLEYFDGSDDILMMNGDTYYDRSLVLTTIDDPVSPILLVDESRRHLADVKVLIRDGMVTRYDKELNQPPDAESADLVKISAQHARLFREALHTMVLEGSVDRYWEEALFRMNSLPVYARDTGGLFWADVDRLEDYQRILAHIDEDSDRTNRESGAKCR